jgi:salicylate hydroxylase
MVTYDLVDVYQIFERSHFSNEIGAAISLCPNASRILKQWGYEFVRSRGVIAEQASLS